MITFTRNCLPLISEKVVIMFSVIRYNVMETWSVVCKDQIRKMEVPWEVQNNGGGVQSSPSNVKEME